LLVLIHPGDLLEHEDAWSEEDWEEVGRFCEENLDGTQKEIARWLDLPGGCDSVVLHRSSCAQFDEFGPWPRDALWTVLQRIWTSGAVLYGDDLDAAGRWIIDNLGVADRPRIYLAGAYSDPESGCLTHIGKMIERVVDPGKITVSGWSPPGSSPGPVWRPSGRVIGYFEAQDEAILEADSATYKTRMRHSVD
jgi:hypothetical protein